MPSASAASVPGLIATHSSAFAPVSERRGSTVTNWPEPSRRARMAANPRAWPTGESQVSRKSAPKETTQRARAKSNAGIAAWPKVRRLASRRLSWPNAS